MYDKLKNACIFIWFGSRERDSREFECVGRYNYRCSFGKGGFGVGGKCEEG